MGQEIMFGLDGPSVRGNWYNPTTGDSFTVRDSFFEDNNMVVLTMDGRKLDYSVIQNYVQSEAPIDKIPSVSPDTTDVKYDMATLLGEDSTLLPSAPSVSDVDSEIIDRAIGESNLPSVMVAVKFDDSIKNVLSMLSNVMKIDSAKISAWLYSKLSSELEDRLRECIDKEISK